MNQQTIAEIRLGSPLEGSARVGETDNPQTLYLLKVTDRNNQDYRELARRAEGQHVAPSDYILLARGSEPGYRRGFAAAAFLSPDSRDIVGRGGTLKWFHYGVARKDDNKRTPFDHNPDVALRQFLIHGSGAKVSIIGTSTDTKPQIVAPDLRVVKSPERDVANRSPQRSRTARAAGLLLGGRAWRSSKSPAKTTRR